MLYYNIYSKTGWPILEASPPQMFKFNILLWIIDSDTKIYQHLEEEKEHINNCYDIKLG